MSERDPIDLRPPAHTDQALLMLIERLSAAQVEQGRSLAKQAEESHEIRLQLAGIASDLKPLVALAGTVSELRIENARHTDDLRRQAARISEVEEDVAELSTAHAKRTGWETFGGKLLYLVGGSAIGTAVTALLYYAATRTAA